MAEDDVVRVVFGREHAPDDCFGAVLMLKRGIELVVLIRLPQDFLCDEKSSTWQVLRRRKESAMPQKDSESADLEQYGTLWPTARHLLQTLSLTFALADVELN